MFNRLTYWFAVLLIALSSCNQEEDTLFIDGELEVYYALFQEEAAKRGITVDYDNAQIEGYIGDIDIEDASGACQQGEPSFILVDQEWWNNASEMEREFLIFHELGHCFLLREHLDDQHTDGSCVSMMHSSSSICDNKYNTETRQAYLDELFNP
ncbi:MAG: putative metallopeptidase [Bacteroidota bacterium]